MEPADRPDEFVLVVDDEQGVRDLMTRWLSSGGYDVRIAANADQAMGLVRSSLPAVALCDVRMPGRDGLWLLERIREEAPETAVIMATGVQDVASAVRSLRQGVVDYLTKPFGRERLRDAVQRGFEWHRAACDARRWRECLEREMDGRANRLAETVGALAIHGDAGLDTLLSALTAADGDVYAHAYRVAALAAGTARVLGFSDADLADLEHAALLHDVGKLAIPDAVLRKPAPLTFEEQALVRRHPAVAADLIGAVPYLRRSADLVRDAHERMDGLGYPRGVPAGEVALGARIIAVADAFDAMTHPRVFRDAIAPHEALLELARCADSQFDPAVVEAFRTAVPV
ncbi:MAG TPA: HD domain-containing phosphohydrolase [Vicinamibacterales bacterium]|nr:HD domain-containing phosphohydrolase [Vicinamibacterales bacterium]